MLLQTKENVLVSSFMPLLISSIASLRVQDPPKRLNSVSSAQALFAEFRRAQGESLIFRRAAHHARGVQPPAAGTKFFVILIPAAAVAGAGRRSVLLD